jgi:L-aminopeptidase/D-esterase-like protein
MTEPRSPKRREFIAGPLLSAAIGQAAGRSADESSLEGGITDVGGIRVGHFTDKRRPTGCTVILFDKGAVAGVDVRGSAPGTRETDLLSPINTVQQVNAILLSGGSAFGLSAADGVMRYLEEQGQGYAVGDLVVPIVPAAILFDLGVGNPKIRPDAESGYQACKAASAGRVAEGSVGAGAGALVGQILGRKRAMKGGIGTASARIGDTGLMVGAILAVNPAGDVIDLHSGSIIAGARTEDGSGFADSMAELKKGHRVRARHGSNSTIGVVATNAKLDKAQATKLAQMAHDGLARTINPIHTPYDGDTIFAAATGTNEAKADMGAIGAVGAEVIAEAVLRAVRRATGLLGIPAYRDLRK